MLRNKIKRTLAGGMCGLIALGLLVINSATSENAAADVLSNSEMSKIVGMCGCHTEVNAGMKCDQAGSGSAPPECGGGCQAYTLAGTNPNKCVSKAPANDWHCEEESEKVTCKTTYTCNTEKKSSMKCDVDAKSCKGGWLWENCAQCTCTADKDEVSSYHCDN
jgi:hypothetical protein